MRVPAQVAIPIVAVCATAGVVLGWLFPLSPSHYRDVEHPQAAMSSRADTGKVRESTDRLTPEDRREDEHVAAPPPLLMPALPDAEQASSAEQVLKSDGPASSPEHVTEDVRTSNERETTVAPSQPAATDRDEQRKPTLSAAEVVTLPLMAGPQAPGARPRNHTEVRPAKSTREHVRGPAKTAQRPASDRTRQQRDDDDPPEREKDRPAREKQPTRSIVSQLPIVGPVFELLIP